MKGLSKVGVRVSIIGAGSGQFSLGIVRDLCLTRSLWGSTVSFMDIDAERLTAIHNVATRYVAEMGADLHFEQTLDRRTSLESADFVVNTAMVDGWARFSAMDELTRAHGYPLGLWLDNHYQYRLFMDIVRDMEAVCPEAWYIQSANPVFEGCTLITRNSRIKAVGLCHGFHGGTRRIAQTLGLDPDQVQAQAYGINHFIWLTHFRYGGRDAYPLLDAWIEEGAQDHWARCLPSDDMGPKAVDVYRRLGLFPVGDTVTPGGGSFFRWYHADRVTEERWREDPQGWMQRHIRHVDATVREFQRVAGDPQASVAEAFPPVPTHETNVSIIDALANDRPAVFQVNIPNRGSIPGIADDVVVEIPALVSGAGIQGLRLDPLPTRIMCHLQEMIANMERDLEAFVTGDRQMLLELVLANPHTRTLDQAQSVLDAVLVSPMNRDMADHYR